MKAPEPDSLNLTLLLDLIEWAMDQINPLSVFLLLVLIAVSFLLGVTTVGVCGIYE